MQGGLTSRRVATPLLLVPLAWSSWAIPSGPAMADVVGWTSAPAQPAEGDVPDLDALGWEPVLDEEFDGSGLDGAVWDQTLGPGVSGPGWNTQDAVRVVDDPDQGGDGLLEILTHTVDTNGSAEGGLQHRTGEVQTGPVNGPGFSSTYGYIEARVDLRSAHNTRSAFWTLGSDSWHETPFGDPAASAPEIDIFEIGHPADGDVRNNTTGTGDEDDPQPDGRCDWPSALQHPCDRVVSGGKHWDRFDEHHKWDRWHRVMPEDFTSQGSHTWGLLWTPDGYRLYVDGVQYYESAEAITYNPEYFIFSVHQGGNLEGTTPVEGYGDLGASTNSRMAIDYLRVWQRPISDIPDRRVAANSPLSMPFSVTDYAYSSPDIAEPQLVRVRATSGNPAVVPSDRVVVTGNPTNPTDAASPDGTTADPDGSTQNAGFESGTTGWTTTAGTATTWTTRRHSGSSALRLAESGGRVEQTITGLRPNTSYTVGGIYNLEVDWTDGNANGLVDWSDTDGDGVCESTDGEAVADGQARFDWGVVDVDASLAGDQSVSETNARDANTERCSWWQAVHRDDWRHRTLRFTTGPSTTSVKLYVANNAYASPHAHDSNLSFDSLYVRPTVPPTRTVTVRPLADTTGSAPITLTAWVDGDYDGTQDAGEQVLGTEQFTVTFTGGSSFTNGDFESVPAGAGWDLWENETGRGVDVVVNDPFTLDRVLELAGPADEPITGRRANGTAFQRVTNLKPNTTYTLQVTGTGHFAFGFSGLSGTNPCATAGACEITASGWQTKSVDFTTDGSGSGTVFLLDWNVADGVSLVDDVRLTTTATGLPQPPLTSPELTALGEQHLRSSVPTAVNFSAANTTVLGVTSSNQDLLPDRNLRVTTGADQKALSLTPTPGRTGRATLTITYSVAGGAPQAHQLSVVVSGDELDNPGFEPGGNDWSSLPLAPAGQQRTGAGALQLPDDGTEVRQIVPALAYTTPYVLSGWVRGAGGASVTVRTVPDMGDTDDQSVAYSSTWAASSAWTEGRQRFETKRCDCPALDSLAPAASTGDFTLWPGSRVEIVLKDANPGDGQAVYLDDLALWRAPTVYPIRDVSIPQNRTSWSSQEGLVFFVGHLPGNAPLNPALMQISSSNPTVLPPANIRVVRREAGYAERWRLQVRATAGSQPTGTSVVTVTVADPHTGIATSEAFTVTVNAGTNVDNGDLERGTAGWEAGWFNLSWEVREKQDWNWLTFRCARPYDSTDWAPCDNPSYPDTPIVGPDDHDQVLRVSSSSVGIRVTGLTPGARYVVRAQALGDGSTLRVVQYDHSGCVDPVAGSNPPVPDESTPCVKSWGTLLGQATINAQLWGATPDLVFTAEDADNPATPWINESDIWLFVADSNTGAVVDPSQWQCAVYAPGETCIDDIGVFLATDVGL